MSSDNENEDVHDDLDNNKKKVRLNDDPLPAPGFDIALLLNLPESLLIDFMSQYLSLKDHANLNNAIISPSKLRGKFLSLFQTIILPKAIFHMRHDDADGYYYRHHLEVNDHGLQKLTNLKNTFPNFVVDDNIALTLINIGKAEPKHEISLDGWHSMCSILSAGCSSSYSRKRLCIEMRNCELFDVPSSFHGSLLSYFPNLLSLELKGFHSRLNAQTLISIVTSLPPNLESLDLSHSLFHGSDLIFTKMMRINPPRHLKHLNIDGLQDITDATFDALSALSSLKSINASLNERYASQTDLPVTSQSFAHLCKIKTLESMELRFWFFVHDEDLQQLSNVPNLKKLVIADELGVPISDSGLQHIIKNCHQLEHLDLNCSDISVNGAATLVSLKSTLKQVKINYSADQSLQSLLPECFRHSLHYWQHCK
jgi:hypothetical protein